MGRVIYVWNNSFIRDDVESLKKKQSGFKCGQIKQRSVQVVWRK